MLIESLEQWTYIAVFVLAAIPWIELGVVVPIGILIGLGPIPVSILGFLGNWLTVILLILLFERWNRWRDKRKRSKMVRSSEVAGEGSSEEGIETSSESSPDSSKRGQRARRIWERYGLPGLALIAPFITGTHIAAAVAMAFKAPKSAVTFWMTLSLAIWTVALAYAAYYGIEFLGLGRTDLFEGNE